MLRTILKLILNAIGLTVCTASWAESLGQVAGGLQIFFLDTAGLVKLICIIFGVGLITMSLISFRAYRQHPEENPLSKAILLCLFGLALIALSFLPPPR